MIDFRRAEEVKQEIDLAVHADHGFYWLQSVVWKNVAPDQMQVPEEFSF